MKLRLLLVSALALAFTVPTALATTGHDAPGADEAPTVDKPKKDGYVKKGDHGDKAEHFEKKEHGDKAHAGKDEYLEKKKAKARDRAKKHSMRDLCRPRVAVFVRGMLVSVNADAGTFTVLVDKANRHGKRFVGREATFKLAKKGKVRKYGKANLEIVEAALDAGGKYLVKVKGRACRSEVRDENETPDLYAKHVKVKAPAHDEAKSHKDKDHGDKGDGHSDEKVADGKDGSDKPKDDLPPKSGSDETSDGHGDVD